LYAPSATPAGDKQGLKPLPNNINRFELVVRDDFAQLCVEISELEISESVKSVKSVVKTKTFLRILLKS